MPPKKEVTAYLDEGGPRPIRKARATLVMGRANVGGPEGLHGLHMADAPCSQLHFACLNIIIMFKF